MSAPNKPIGDTLDTATDTQLNELFAVARPRNKAALCYSPEYKSWAAMIYRCTNPKAANFHRYGGRGVKICATWTDFRLFLRDMGRRPHGTTLDRFPDRNGNYEKGNCRWATPKQQSRNMSSNTIISAFGESKTLADWGEDPRFSITAPALSMRIKRGVPAEEALTLPLGRHYHSKKRLTTHIGLHSFGPLAAIRAAC